MYHHVFFSRYITIIWYNKITIHIMIHVSPCVFFQIYHHHYIPIYIPMLLFPAIKNVFFPDISPSFDIKNNDDISFSMYHHVFFSFLSRYITITIFPYIYISYMYIYIYIPMLFFFPALNLHDIHWVWGFPSHLFWNDTELQLCSHWRHWERSCQR